MSETKTPKVLPWEASEYRRRIDRGPDRAPMDILVTRLRPGEDAWRVVALALVLVRGKRGGKPHWAVPFAADETDFGEWSERATWTLDDGQDAADEALSSLPREWRR